MDQVTTHTMGLFRGDFKKVQGSTSKLYEKVDSEDELHEKTRKNQEKRVKELSVFVDRFRASASKSKQVKSKIKMIDKMGVNDKLQDEALLNFKFSYLAALL